MNHHKLFRELFDFPTEDIWNLKELLDLVQDARNDFERVGTPFSYDAFKAYAHRVLEPRVTSSGTYGNTYKKQLQIIDGDNLDIIEEAAKDKGLL